MSGVFGEYSYNDKHGMMYKSNYEFEKKVRNIIREEIDRYMIQFKNQLANEIEIGVLSALCYDVETIVNVSISNANDMLSSEKVRSFVSGRIAAEIEKRIKNIKLNI